MVPETGVLGSAEEEAVAEVAEVEGVEGAH